MQESQSTRKPSKTLKVIGIALLILLILGVIGSASKTKETVDNATSTTDTSSTEQAGTSSKPIAKIGDAVRDGKFEFVVNKMSCGETTVGSQYLKAEAQGQFCRINVTVKNIGNEPQTLSHSDQYAYNAQNQKYSADTEAAIYANSDSTASNWYNDINPGNTVTGDLFFDVPKELTLAKIELHDSAFSSGITVLLQ